MDETAPNRAHLAAQNGSLDSSRQQESNTDEYFSSVSWKRTYGQAYSLVRNPADAEDIAQEAHLRLFEAVLSGRQIESCVAWMRGVVRNVVFQQHRETRPDLHVHVDTQDGAFESSILNVADPATSAEDKVINQSLLEESLRVLDELPDRDRECIMMYARGYTFVQIATVLNISYDVAIRSTRKALLKTRRRIAR